MQRRPALALLAVLVTIPCLMLFSVTVRSLDGSIYDVHEWRQGETYSIAYAFIHESASFFYPKHAWRGNLTGIVGMEAPIYPYVVSWLMRVFGESFTSARVLNFTLFVLAFSLQGRRLIRLLGLPYALGYLLMAAFSPATLTEFRQMQPDPATCSLAIMASVYLHDHGRTGTRKSFAFGLGLYTLSLLTKPIVIAMLPAMYLFAVVGARRPTLRAAAAKLALFAIPVALMSAWDHWANELVQRYMEGNLLISIDHDPARMWAEMNDIGARRFILLGLLENYASNVAVFPAVVLGIPYAMRKETRSWGIPFLAWLAGAVVISLAFSSRYFTNGYYMLPYVPPLLFFGAMSFGALFEVIALGARDPLRLGVAIAVVLAAALVNTQLPTLPWEYTGHEAAQLALHVRHAVANGNVYWSLIVVAIASAATLLMLRDTWVRLPHALLALLLLGTGCAALVVPFKDQDQTVRFYTQIALSQQGHDDLKELRAAVDEHSTPSDLFLMSGSHPGLLTRARRVGWAEDPGAIDALGVPHFTSRGARFYIAFPDIARPAGAAQSATLLAHGARWELRCIDPKGCEPKPPRAATKP